MLERLMERAKTSGRADDNHDSIVKRFREYPGGGLTPVLWFKKIKNKIRGISPKR